MRAVERHSDKNTIIHNIFKHIYKLYTILQSMGCMELGICQGRIISTVQKMEDKENK